MGVVCKGIEVEAGAQNLSKLKSQSGRRAPKECGGHWVIVWFI